jgi:hypothetical protein
MNALAIYAVESAFVLDAPKIRTTGSAHFSRRSNVL